jgi:hypothetical protein
MRLLIKLFLVAILVTGSCYAFAKSPVVLSADSSVMVDSHLSGFTRIKIAGPFEVHLIQGPIESVKFEEPQDVRGRIVVEVTGGVLKIRKKHDNWGQGPKSWYSDKSAWNNHKKISVYITAKELEGITLSGSCSVSFANGLTSARLNLKVRGSGVMSGKVEVKKLEARVSGSGHIGLSGTAESSAVKVVGSGTFSSPDLVTANSAAHVSGSGNARINATEEVDATVHGSGVVSYTGAAKIVRSSTSGSGAISRF